MLTIRRAVIAAYEVSTYPFKVDIFQFLTSVPKYLAIRSF